MIQFTPDQNNGIKTELYINGLNVFNISEQPNSNLNEKGKNRSTIDK